MFRHFQHIGSLLKNAFRFVVYFDGFVESTCIEVFAAIFFCVVHQRGAEAVPH
jgi:hypothetical protein